MKPLMMALSGAASGLFVTFVAMKMYSWHVRPLSSSLPALSFSQVWAISLTLFLFVGIHNADFSRPTDTSFDTAQGLGFVSLSRALVALVILGIGYLLS